MKHGALFSAVLVLTGHALVAAQGTGPLAPAKPGASSPALASYTSDYSLRTPAGPAKPGAPSPALASPPAPPSGASSPTLASPPAPPCGALPEDLCAPPLCVEPASKACGPCGRVWVGAEYLLWWV